MDGIEFHQLVRTFQNVETLPQLPDSAIRLVQVCEDPESNLHDAEQVVASDAGLITMVLKAASTARYASTGAPATTVNAAVMRLGMRALQSLAMAHAFRSLLHQRHESDYYDPARLAKHSIFSGLATQFLFDREYGSRGHDLEEVFTFGLLHDLGACLFATVAPNLFDECWKKAMKGGETFEQTFLKIYEEPLATLGWAAATAWGLPDIFVEFLHARTRRDDPSDLQPVDDIVVMADDFAPAFGYAFEPWLESLDIVGLNKDEQQELKHSVDEYCAHAFSMWSSAA